MSTNDASWTANLPCGCHVGSTYRIPCASHPETGFGMAAPAAPVAPASELNRCPKCEAWLDFDPHDYGCPDFVAPVADAGPWADDQQYLFHAEAVVAGADRQCVWLSGNCEGFWATGCGQSVWLEDEGPKAKGMLYCWICGGALVESEDE